MRFRGVIVVICMLCILLYYYLSLESPQLSYKNFSIQASTPIHSKSTHIITKPATILSYRSTDFLWNEYFGRKPPTVNCEAFAKKDIELTNRYLWDGRLTMKENPKDLDLSCDGIRKRVIDSQYNNNGFRSYAVCRNIYTDYFLHEILLSIGYHDENVYCFALDSKTHANTQKMIRRLETCLENVRVLNKTYNFSSGGQFQDIAHVDCLRAIEHKNWSYALLAQNDDIILRTQSEMDEIMQTLNGTQGIDVSGRAPSNRYNINLDWTGSGMKLFSREVETTRIQRNTRLKLMKSPNQVFLSKEFVSDILHVLNITTILHTLNNYKNESQYGVDEILMASLFWSEHLGIRGQSNTNQLSNGTSVRLLVEWNAIRAGLGECSLSRHGVCLLGVEHLHLLKSSKHILANKVWPSFDAAAILCWAEVLKARSRLSKLSQQKVKTSSSESSSQHIDMYS